MAAAIDAFRKDVPEPRIRDAGGRRARGDHRARRTPELRDRGDAPRSRERLARDRCRSGVRRGPRAGRRRAFLVRRRFRDDRAHDRRRGDAAARLARGERPRLQPRSNCRKPVVSAIRGTAVGRGPCGRLARGHFGRGPEREDPRRPHAPRRRGGRPFRHHLAAPVRPREGALLPADERAARREEAERIGLGFALRRRRKCASARSRSR